MVQAVTGEDIQGCWPGLSTCCSAPTTSPWLIRTELFTPSELNIFGCSALTGKSALVLKGARC
jgi:hypothetical protein